MRIEILLEPDAPALYRWALKGENQMLTVHHLGVSQSERIVWLCEELEIPYELVIYDRDPVTRLAPPQYKALHPMGTAPVITDGDLIMSESGAIMEYIIARHGGGRLSVPADDPNFPDYLFWLHFANASVMPAGMVAMIMGILQIDEANPLRGALGARGVNAFAMI
jgi:glutathione S-transferase